LPKLTQRDAPELTATDGRRRRRLELVLLALLFLLLTAGLSWLSRTGNGVSAASAGAFNNRLYETSTDSEKHARHVRKALTQLALLDLCLRSPPGAAHPCGLRHKSHAEIALTDSTGGDNNFDDVNFASFDPDGFGGGVGGGTGGFGGHGAGGGGSSGGHDSDGDGHSPGTGGFFPGGGGLSFDVVAPPDPGCSTQDTSGCGGGTSDGTNGGTTGGTNGGTTGGTNGGGCTGADCVPADPTAVPEPATLFVFAAGAAALFSRRRRSV